MEVYIYKNRHGREVKMTQQLAEMYGDRMKPINKAAKELRPLEKNNSGEKVKQTIHK